MILLAKTLMLILDFICSWWRLWVSEGLDRALVSVRSANSHRHQHVRHRNQGRVRRERWRQVHHRGQVSILYNFAPTPLRVYHRSFILGYLLSGFLLFVPLYNKVSAISAPNVFGPPSFSKNFLIAYWVYKFSLQYLSIILLQNYPTDFSCVRTARCSLVFHPLCFR